MVYEKRIVAFFDILGFSEQIYKTSDDEALQKKIFTACEEIKKIHQNKSEIKDVKYSFFSDSFIISYPFPYSLKNADNSEVLQSGFSAEDNALVNLLTDLLEHIYIIQSNFLLPIRGGVVAGELLHDDDKIFGPAFIDAYLIEAKIAVYPRIVISPKILSNQMKKFADDGKTDGLVKDYDGQYFLDHLQLCYFISKNYPFPQFLTMHLTNTRKVIDNLIQSSSRDIKVQAKTKWYIEYYNRFITKNKIKEFCIFDEPNF